MLRRFLFHAAKFSSYPLVVFAATMRFAAAAVRRTMRRATMRCRGMGGTMRGATTRCYGMGATCGRTTVGPAAAPSAHCRWPTSTIGCISTSAAVSTAGDVSSSSATVEAMITPTVAIAPASPRAHA